MFEKTPFIKAKKKFSIFSGLGIELRILHILHQCYINELFTYPSVLIIAQVKKSGLFSEHGMSLQHIWILLTTSYKSKYPWETILIIQMGKQFAVGFMIEGLARDALALKLSKLDKKVDVLLKQSLTRMMSGGLGLWRALASHLPNTALWFHKTHMLGLGAGQ